MSMESPATLSIGTHTWVPGDSEKIDKILDVVRKNGIAILDTARSYGLGASEAALGERHLATEFAIDTKAATGVMAGTGKMIAQFAEESLKALQTDKVRTFFMHAPDETVPLGEQVEAIHELFKDGKFERFGLSNFTCEQVVECYNYAKARDYVLPTVYQGSYSIAVRLNETRLFPTLRDLGISIQAYSPMAAGLLAKTPEYIEQGKGSWNPHTVTGKIYRDLYYKPSYMRMLDEFGQLSATSGISRCGLAYRWVRYHSALNGSFGDEIILGAASAEQLEETLAELEKGRLESWVVARIDKLWELIKEDAPVDNLKSVRKVWLESA